MQTAKFYFKNIGPVKKAELELGDLTIIAGRNNTGKTYLVYTLYGFLKSENVRPWDMLSHVEEIAMEIMEMGYFKRTVDQETLNQERKEIIHDLSRSFSKRYLADVFSSSHDVFQGASIEIELPDKIFKDIQLETIIRTSGLLSIQYDGTDIIITGKNINKKSLRIRNNLFNISNLYRQFIIPELP